MDGRSREYPTVSEALYAKAIGEQVLDFLKREGLEKSARTADNDAAALLERVREILNDQTLSDLECFRRVEALVDAFGKAGIYTSRHDW